MYGLCWLMLAGVAITLNVLPARAEERPKDDCIQVEVDGSLGSLIQSTSGDGLVSASVLAGGGELFLDCSQSETARDDLKRLAERHLKPASWFIILPRVTVKGRLEFRTTKISDEKGKLTDGRAIWVIVVDTLAIAKQPAK